MKVPTIAIVSASFFTMGLAAEQAQDPPPKKPSLLERMKKTVSDATKKKMGDAPDDMQSSSGTPQRPTVTDTVLAGIFDKFPWRDDVRTPDGVGWPRVAITMTQAPSWHRDKPTAGNRVLPGKGCWQFTAKVWDSATQERDVSAFYQCDALRIEGGDMTRVLMFGIWAGVTGPRMAPGGESTGLQRNDGPVPPDTPFPNSVAYQRAAFSSSYSGIALRMIIDATHIDYSQRDRRLWVIVAPELEPGR